MAGRGEGVPGDVEPAMAGEELVGERPGFEERDVLRVVAQMEELAQSEMPGEASVI